MASVMQKCNFRSIKTNQATTQRNFTPLAQETASKGRSQIGKKEGQESHGLATLLQYIFLVLSITVRKSGSSCALFNFPRLYAVCKYIFFHLHNDSEPTTPPHTSLVMSRGVQSIGGDASLHLSWLTKWPSTVISRYARPPAYMPPSTQTATEGFNVS